MSRSTQDKVTVSGNYDPSGRCISIFIYLNDSVITAEDIAFAVRAVFRPDDSIRVSGPTKWNPPPSTVRGSASAADTVTDLRITDDTSASRKWF